MEIRYLGTAASEGYPALFCNCKYCVKARAEGGKSIRTRSQAIIDNKILIDFPPDTYMHSLYGKLSLNGVESLLVTHAHSDHYYPEDIINRGGVYAHNQSPTRMTVYGNGTVEAMWKEKADAEGIKDLETNVLFKHANVFEPFLTDTGYNVTAMPALYNRHENCYIYLIEKDGKRLLYAHDTGIFHEEVWDFLKKKHIDFASLDCNAGKYKEGTNHMGFPDNRVVIDRLREIGSANDNTIFVANHFSHNCEMTNAEIADRAEKEGMLMSYDGFAVKF